MPELADIFRLHGFDYIAQYQDRLLPSHRRAIQDICACRTQTMGGHLYLCPQCNKEHYQYHSCKNRHCPKCQNDQIDRWINQQRQFLLPVPYFMATFTLPSALRRLVRSNQKLLYHLLFQSSQQALQKLASDPKHIGGTIGMIGILQTWTRDLRYHPHVHYLIPGGGMSAEARTWLPVKRKYLLPEKPLAKIFRAKFRDLLKKNGLFHLAPSQIWRKDWVVDIIPVGSGEAALKYLAPMSFAWPSAIETSSVSKTAKSLSATATPRPMPLAPPLCQPPTSSAASCNTSSLAASRKCEPMDSFIPSSNTSYTLSKSNYTRNALPPPNFLITLIWHAAPPAFPLRSSAPSVRAS